MDALNLQSMSYVHFSTLPCIFQRAPANYEMVDHSRRGKLSSLEKPECMHATKVKNLKFHIIIFLLGSRNLETYVWIIVLFQVVSYFENGEFY